MLDWLILNSVRMSAAFHFWKKCSLVVLALTQQNATYNHASLEEQVVYGLCDISSVHQVVVWVFVFAVAHLQ